MKRTPHFLLVATLLSAGCSTWRTTADLDQIPMPADSTKSFDLWGKGEHWKLRALTIDADSVHGRSLSCDSCRVALPRAAVDSIRSQSVDGGESAAVGIAMAAILLPLLALLAWAGSE